MLSSLHAFVKGIHPGFIHRITPMSLGADSLHVLAVGDWLWVIQPLHHGEEPEAWVSLPVVMGVVGMILVGGIAWYVYSRSRE